MRKIIIGSFLVAAVVGIAAMGAAPTSAGMFDGPNLQVGGAIPNAIARVSTPALLPQVPHYGPKSRKQLGRANRAEKDGVNA